MTLTALIVVDPTTEGDSGLDLQAALRADSTDVHRTTVRAILDGEHDRIAPDILLMHARLTMADVKAVGQHLLLGERSPPLLVFCGHDYSLLEPHLRAGYDYLLPPFLPWLVRARINSCQPNHRPVSTVEEIEALAHLLKYERELQIAREIQRGFLPPQLPHPDGWQVEVRLRHAREVGGDFYDGFELINGRRVGFLVADVCDKGMGAALFMALVRTLLRHTALSYAPGTMLVSDLDSIAGAVVGEPAGVADRPQAKPTIGATPLLSAVRGANDYMIRNHFEQGYFVTVFFFVLDPAAGTVTYVNAGHNPAVVLRNDGSVEWLQPTGPALGLIHDATFRLGHVTLHEGETLFAYTDGVTEARNEEGELFSEGRMLELLIRSNVSARDLVYLVDSAVNAFVGGAEQFDDVTMLAVRRVRPEEAAAVDLIETPESVLG